MTTSLLMTKIIDISAARRRRDRQERMLGMPNREKRDEFRYKANSKLFVQIISSSDPELVGTTISCIATDVSANGLRIEADQVIPDKCQLDLWVDNGSGPGKFFLSSSVQWTDSFDGLYYAGVQLHEGPTTDIAAWRARYSNVS